MKSPSANATYRSLISLEKSGATTRVLNLAAIAGAHGGTPEHAQRPFFVSPQLNRSMVLKHRPRSDDALMSRDHRGVATKVIIPFDPEDLSTGGSSFLVGQVGWTDILRDLCDGEPTFIHDLTVLETLNQLPSFDPFLLREALQRRKMTPADCYFAIGPGDRERMRRYVEREIAPLIDMAYADRAAARESTAKLVEILLSSDTDERLEPLRHVLRLEGERYRAGIFSWKGFLYYKWATEALMADLRPVMNEVPRLESSDRYDVESARFIATLRGKVLKLLQHRLVEVANTLDTYDTAFTALTRGGDPLAFREFLVNAPATFMQLGERIGVLAHVASYWRYRFPAGGPLRAPIEQIIELLEDFELGLNQTLLSNDPAPAPPPRQGGLGDRSKLLL